MSGVMPLWVLLMSKNCPVAPPSFADRVTRAPVRFSVPPLSATLAAPSEFDPTLLAVGLAGVPMPTVPATVAARVAPALTVNVPVMTLFFGLATVGSEVFVRLSVPPLMVAFRFVASSWTLIALLPAELVRAGTPVAGAMVSVPPPLAAAGSPTPYPPAVSVSAPVVKEPPPNVTTPAVGGGGVNVASEPAVGTPALQLAALFHWLLAVAVQLVGVSCARAVPHSAKPAAKAIATRNVWDGQGIFDGRAGDMGQSSVTTQR